MNDKDVLAPLVDELLELAARPIEAEKKKLWADHQAMRPTEKIPVCVYYEGIPAAQWTFMLGDDYLKCESAMAQGIETDLRKRIWMAQNVNDDHIVWPWTTVAAVTSTPVSWGVDFKMVGTGDEASEAALEGRRMVPAFPDGIDISQLHFTNSSFDDHATALATEQANEMLDGRLSVKTFYPSMGHTIFDIAVEMRGMESLMFDVIDATEKVHALMNALTASFVTHHKTREKNGWINCPASDDGQYAAFGFRVHCAYTADDFNAATPRLCDEWAYVSAQTSSCLGPDMYAEFVHPYNCRLAELHSNDTVYYHGCECLDKKLDIIATLPHLRRFHVSPWSAVATAVETFKGSVVMEVHAHPGKVFFGFTANDMRNELAHHVDQAQGLPLDLNLSDIHSNSENPSLLTQWAQVAQEIAHK